MVKEQKGSPEDKGSQDNRSNGSYLEEELGTGELLLEVEEKEKEALAKQKLEDEEAEEEKKKKDQGEKEKDTPAQEDLPPGELPKEEIKDPEQPKRPDWLPKKFKTPEAVAKAYVESEKQKTKAEQEAATLRKLLENKKEHDADKSVDKEEYYNKLVADPVGTLKPLVKRELNEMMLEQQEKAKKVSDNIEALSEKYPDFNELRAQTAVALEALPKEVTDNEKVNAIEIAYKVAKGEAKGNVSEAKKEIEKKDIVDKKKTFVETDSAVDRSSPAQKITKEEEIANSIMAAGKEHPLFI